MKLWATGIKDWVIVRKSASSPKCIETKVVQEVKERQIAGWRSYPDDYLPRYKMVTKKMDIIQLDFEGGKVVATIPYRKFKDLTKIGVGPGGIIELRKYMVVALKEQELI